MGALAALKDDNQEHFEEWQAHALEAIPKVERFEILQTDDEIRLDAHMRGGFSINATQLSLRDRVMGLTLLSYQFPSGALLGIECPETGLHPSMIEPVAQPQSRRSCSGSGHNPLPNWVG